MFFTPFSAEEIYVLYIWTLLVRWSAVTHTVRVMWQDVLQQAQTATWRRKTLKTTLKTTFFGAISDARAAATTWEIKIKKKQHIDIPGSFECTSLSSVDSSVHQELIYYMCHYTYFYILSTIVGKVSGFDGAKPCHWSGLRLQLDSQPLEGDGASSCCWLSSGSVSSDRKLGNVCARGMKVIVRPLPVGKKRREISGAHLSLSTPTWFLSVSPMTRPVCAALYFQKCSCLVTPPAGVFICKKEATKITLALSKTSDVGGSHIIMQK